MIRVLGMGRREIRGTGLSGHVGITDAVDRDILPPLVAAASQIGGIQDDLTVAAELANKRIVSSLKIRILGVRSREIR